MFLNIVADPESVEAAVVRAVDAFGGLDVVYNNAGGATANDGKVTEIPREPRKMYDAPSASSSASVSGAARPTIINPTFTGAKPAWSNLDCVYVYQ